MQVKSCFGERSHFTQDIPDNYSTRVMQELIDCLDGVILKTMNGVDGEYLTTSTLVSVSKYYTESMFKGAIKTESLKIGIEPKINWTVDDEGNIYRVYGIKRNYNIYVGFTEKLHQAFFMVTYK